MMTSISAFLEAQPKWWLVAVGILVVIAFWSNATGNWNSQVQVIVIGGVCVLVLASMGEKEKEPISINEAIRAGERFVREKQIENAVETGTLVPIPQAKIVKHNGIPNEYAVGIRLLSGENPVHVIGINPYKNKKGDIVITSWSVKPDWTTDDRPNVEIITPPDVVTLLNMEKEMGLR